MVFLLSAPRSGSTLLRLMLAGSPELFCPPELGLLSVSSLGSWGRHRLPIFAQDGATRAFMELEEASEEETRRRIDRMIELDEPVQDVYRRLQDACGARLLVDKSPAYALSPETLQRADALFEKPRFIFLTRHPVAVIESLVRHRMERLLASTRVEDPWRFAEGVWTAANDNLLHARGAGTDRRWLRVSYEELVCRPENTMRELSDFLDVAFDPAMLEPYSGGRMIDGPGDPDIFQHDRIEPELAEAWKRVTLPFRLGARTREVAHQLGYPLPDDVAEVSDTCSDATSADSGPALDPLQASRLLERLDELSDEEVDQALRALRAGGDGDG